MNGLELDDGVRIKLVDKDFMLVNNEWVTTKGHHRLVEMIVAYYSGNKYNLKPYPSRDCRIASIFNMFSHLRKRTDQLPYECKDTVFCWDDSNYWFVDSNGDTYMLTQK